ncbi:hypothetical protein BKA70DRAFT_372362 [Coprinopsis sp. MPI-PUGE-AT-0042]|nr:hypothetical protein BKA70DRAFT_372362 [Coprinopsis sp. MPI-PUGE-AT-0042]
MFRPCSCLLVFSIYFIYIRTRVISAAPPVLYYSLYLLMLLAICTPWFLSNRSAVKTIMLTCSGKTNMMGFEEPATLLVPDASMVIAYGWSSRARRTGMSQVPTLMTGFTR